MAPILPFLPLIAAGIGAAATGVAIADEPSAPKAPSAATTAQQQAEAASAAAIAQASALTSRRGMASTVLQNPLSGGTASITKSTLGA